MFRLPTVKILGHSIYLSSFATVKPMLERAGTTGALVFTSLHISEEFSEHYCEEVRAMCRWLTAAGYHIIADISPKTVKQFGCADITQLARELDLYALRIDYGFTERDIAAIAGQIPVVLNASTTNPAAARQILRTGGQVAAMHNYYPRPETGLDDAFLLETTHNLHDCGIPVLGFIAGDDQRRGPLNEGLPVLEHHRNIPPLVAYADLVQNFQLDAVFLGDITLSDKQRQWINEYAVTGVLPVPAELSQAGKNLYERVFTCRPDSPAGLVRFQESREYSCCGEHIEPENCGERPTGAITIDNIGYKRYSGEVQLTRRHYPADARVNVIGRVVVAYLPIVDCLPRGGKFRLVEP